MELEEVTYEVLATGDKMPSGYYLKADVDAVIAELKEEVNNLLMQNKELCQALQVMYSAEEYTKLQNKNAELKAENKLLKEHIANGDVSRITWIDEVIELKAKLHDAEMRADLAEAANTEYRIDLKNIKDNIAKHARNQYHKHNRQTLRALWLARAERAEAEHAHWATIWFCNTKIVLNINKSSVSQDPYKSNTFKNASEWRNMWYDIASKCLKKAKEYK